jgi:hypothetical protein
LERWRGLDYHEFYMAGKDTLRPRKSDHLKRPPIGLSPEQNQRGFSASDTSRRKCSGLDYVRVSTNDQQTLPMQNRALREYATQRGWTITLQVREVGSVSVWMYCGLPFTAFCERLIKTIRRECLDYRIPFNQRHARKILREWAVHYNFGRPNKAPGPITALRFRRLGAKTGRKGRT